MADLANSCPSACAEMISEIRPEDFEIRYRSKNRYRFMGNGRTKMEYDPKAVSIQAAFDASFWDVFC